MRQILGLAVLMLFAPLARADGPFLLKDGQRIVFLGDSNTYAGKYIAYLDAYLCTRFPEKRFELINLGLPSETVSGLSEPDHPYPRPNVHDRIDNALEVAKPDVVVICYGMNDGIYYPFSEERFKKYQQGIATLIEKVEKYGAKAILMSPAPFDAQPMKDKVQPKTAAKFSWLRPYERYDEEVLTKYSEWLLTLRDRKYIVIDGHAAVLKHLETMRKQDPMYRVSGDGIHPNANGHLVIALEILKEWKAPSAVRDIVIDVRKDPPSESNLSKISARKNGATFSFALPLPMPADPAWGVRVKKIERFDERVNRYPLKIEGLGGLLTLRSGTTKANARRLSINADTIAMGIDYADLLKMSQEKETAAIWKLIDEKNRVLGPAWLTHVGHKRPDTPKGLPFAEATKKAAALEEQIRVLCRPIEIQMGIGPIGK
jgi:lysophospholipase L1-like esterase